MRANINTPALTLSFRLGLRKGRAERLFTFGTLLIYLTLVVSYAQIIRAMPDATLSAVGLTHPQLVWYLVLAEGS